MVYLADQMAVGAELTALAGEELSSEKRFYLDEFHEKTLFFAFAPGSGGEDEFAPFLATVRELVREDVRVIVMVQEEDLARRLEGRFRRLAAASLSEPLFPGPGDGRRRRTIVVEAEPGAPPELPVLMRLWELLRQGPIAVLRTPQGAWTEMVRQAVRLASRLRVYKLILVDPEGGVNNGSVLSFLDESVLATLLGAGEAEWAGLGHRRALIEAIRDGLLGGIPSINLCSREGLDRELFTYEGSGTLFTYEDYCRVERLGIDDFREVERLLERGSREGFLKIRSPEEIAEILFTGYGATIGSGHLAGVGSLLCDPYEAEQTGEVVALYTISRFKAEGVGAKILARILEDGRARRLKSVFACTTEEGAGQFFARHGFRRVTPADVPQAKWQGYDRERMERLSVFRMEFSEP